MGWNPWNRPFNCFPILETVIIDTWYQLKFGVSLEVTESRFRSIHLQYQALHSSNKIFIKISYWIYTHTPSSQSYSYNQDTIYYKWATMGQCEDDIKILFPVVHSILIRMKRVYQLYILIGWQANQRQIAAAELRLMCEDNILNYSI